MKYKFCCLMNNCHLPRVSFHPKEMPPNTVSTKTNQVKETIVQIVQQGRWYVDRHAMTAAKILKIFAAVIACSLQLFYCSCLQMVLKNNVCLHYNTIDCQNCLWLCWRCIMSFFQKVEIFDWSVKARPELKNSSARLWHSKLRPSDDFFKFIFLGVPSFLGGGALFLARPRLFMP